MFGGASIAFFRLLFLPENSAQSEIYMILPIDPAKPLENQKALVTDRKSVV